MPRILPASCSAIAALFFVSVQAVAALSGPIKATKTISAFPLPPNNVNSLTVAGDGNGYGAATQGYLVRITPTGAFSVIHDFHGEAATTPNALTLGKDGNLYGILSSNGSIFKSDLTGKITILATLGAAAQPISVFQAADGNLYGITFAAGSANQGSLFKVTPTGQLSIIHNFAGDAAGYQPTNLIETTPNVFYGVCRSSSYGSRAIFRLTADGAFTIVHDFSGTNDSFAANLVFAGDGNVYGSYEHFDGGYSIFRLTPSGELTPITSFAYDHAINYMVLGGDGNLYATTGYGVSGNREGGISRITVSGQVTLLHAFTGQDDGGNPTHIAVGPNQVFYGVTAQGSAANHGTIYRIDSAGQFATLVRLGAIGEGYSPNGGFFQANDGSFYGATDLGGSGGYGTIYRIAPSGDRATLHEFAADTGAPTLLVLGKDGQLYGACSRINGLDSLFRLATSGAFTLLHTFPFGEAGVQVTALVASQDGNIYGIATSPSTLSNPKYGSFFRIAPAGTFNVVKVFDQNLGSPVGLVETKDGKLYGLGSGSNGQVLFQIAADGATTVVHSFSGDPIRGNFGALVVGADGNLYGTMSGILTETSHGTNVVNGGLWRCSPAGTFALLHTFDNVDGLFYPSLLVATENGDLYGLVGVRGLVGGRAIYRFTAGGVFEPLYTIDQGVRGLIEGTDKNLYGTVGFGGPFGGGTLFKFVFGSPSAVNLATRMKVGTGNNVSIGGFIITGNGPKKVLLRGIGPSLSLAGKLDDPMLDLHDASGAVIGRNDNWRVTQPGGVVSGDQSAEIKASGLAPTDDLESALIASLSPGNYTAVVSGTQNTSGIGVVEIYDLDLEASANLANISTRGFADTGDNVLIGGFITNGSSYGRSRLVVRALGPSLAQFGISNPLNDPSLAIYDQNGGQIATNDNWQDGNQPEIVSYGLAPNDPHEAALYLSVAAGNYTAVVTGSNGATGVALVETYNLP